MNFILPPEGSFAPNDPVDDPLYLYYRPIVGHLYKKRIQTGLNLLDPSYESCLEFGYGSGLLLPTLAPICKKLSGIDIASAPDKVRPALDRLNITADLKQADITKVGYPGGSFDLIVGFSVFEHIADPDEILKEMRRILKPGGKLLVGMPRVDSFMSKLFRFIIRYKNIDDHHVTSFKKFLSFADKYFIVRKKAHMPSFLPSMFGLYFTVLLERRD